MINWRIKELEEIVARLIALGDNISDEEIEQLGRAERELDYLKN